MFCPTFDAINGKFTLGDIQVIAQDGKEYDASDRWHRLTGGLNVQKLKNGAAAMGTTWSYTTSNGRKWSTNNNNTNEFESGEGVIVYNNSSNLFFRVSGQVALEPMYCIPGGGKYSIWGNNTPRKITLGDISVYAQDGKEYDASDRWHRLTGGLNVQKLKNGAAAMGTTWSYTTSNGKKWSTNNNNTNELAAGEALIVYNNSSNLYFKVKSPLAD